MPRKLASSCVAKKETGTRSPNPDRSKSRRTLKVEYHDAEKAGFKIWPTDTLLPCYRTDLTVVNPYDSLNVLTLFNNSLGAVHPSGYRAH